MKRSKPRMIIKIKNITNSKAQTIKPKLQGIKTDVRESKE